MQAFNLADAKTFVLAISSAEELRGNDIFAGIFNIYYAAR
jgi:hypothetical protein